MRNHRNLLPLLGLLGVATVVLPAGVASRPVGKALRGRVVTESGTPVDGAAVRVRPVDGSDGESERVVSGRRGAWATGPLSSGRWVIEISKEGFETVEGVLELPWAETLETVLPTDAGAVSRSRLAEGRAAAASGRYDVARADFGAVLTIVPDVESGPLHRELGKILTLAGRSDEAILELETALVLDSEDGEARTMLEEAGGPSAEGVSAWLRRLDDLGPEEAARLWLPEIEEYPPLAHRVGRFRTRFSESADAPGPLSASEPADESFEIYVPAGYGPGDEFGLLVWVSPNPNGHIPGPGFFDVLDRHRVIWIGPNRAGNQRPGEERVALARLAARNMRFLYSIDPSRVYVAGYSGGGRVASALAILFPEEMKGAICYMGVNFFEPLPAPHQIGKIWPPRLRAPDGPTWSQVLRNRGFFLIAGEFDFNRFETRAVAAALRDRGHERVWYHELEGVGHFQTIPPETLEAALRALDGVSEKAP